MNIQRFNELVRMGVPALMAAEDSVYWKGGSSKQTSETTSTTKSTPTQTNQYQNLLSGADSWLNQGFIRDYAYGGDTVVDMTQGQKDSLGEMANTGNDIQRIYNTYGQPSLAQALGPYDPNNTGLKAAIDASNDRMNWDFQTQVAPQIRQGAIDTGQYGSSRSGIAEGIANTQLNQQKMNAASQMAFQDQQAFNNNKTNLMNNLSNITKGLTSGHGMKFDAGTIEQRQGQAEADAQLERWAYDNNIDLNNLMAYKQLITGDMGGENVTNSKSTMKGGGGSGWGNMLAGIGGQFGGQFAGQLGSNMGAGILG